MCCTGARGHGSSHQQPHTWDEDCESDSARFTAEVNLYFTTLSVHKTTGQLWTLRSLHMVKPDEETYVRRYADGMRMSRPALETRGGDTSDE